MSFWHKHNAEKGLTQRGCDRMDGMRDRMIISGGEGISIKRNPVNSSEFGDLVWEMIRRSGDLKQGLMEAY